MELTSQLGVFRGSLWPMFARRSGALYLTTVINLGIGRATLRMLIEESERKPFAGRLVTFGRQTIIDSPVDDVAIFKSMGFGEVESIDYSSFEGATQILDLNQPIPDHLRGQFDVVLDSGTTEHIFHIPNALKNAVDLAKVGGRIIFCSPASNYVDHGFYSFSPTLFVDYFTANNLTVERCLIVRASLDSHRPWKAWEYRPEAGFFIGCLDGGIYTLFVVATKTATSTSDRTPTQAHYQEAWKQAPVREARWRSAVKSALSKIPFAMAVATMVNAYVKRRGLHGLRYVGKY